MQQKCLNLLDIL